MKGRKGEKEKKKKRKGKGEKIRKSETEALPRPLAGKAREGGERRKKCRLSRLRPRGLIPRLLAL